MGKMKDSSLLKWTQNNKNNKLVGNKEKKEKKSKEEKNKNWLHTPENLTSGHIAYLVKVSNRLIVPLCLTHNDFSFWVQRRWISLKVLKW